MFALCNERHEAKLNTTLELKSYYKGGNKRFVAIANGRRTLQEICLSAGKLVSMSQILLLCKWERLLSNT